MDFFTSIASLHVLRVFKPSHGASLSPLSLSLDVDGQKPSTAVFIEAGISVTFLRTLTDESFEYRYDTMEVQSQGSSARGNIYHFACA